MTGIPSGHWGGKFVAVADPAPAPAAGGLRARPPLEALEYRGQLLDRAVVVRRAEEALKAYSLHTREAYRRVLERAIFGQPVLVQRLDLADTFYYIAPAAVGERVPLAVAIDAKTGIYLQSAVHSGGDGSVISLRPRKEIADLILGTTIELPNRGGRIPIRAEAVCQYPNLVWRPCRESLSPFYPFHLFTIGNERIYVRTDGAIFTELHYMDCGI